MEAAGELSATQAKAVLADLLAAGGGDPAAIAAAKGFEALADDSWSPTWSARWWRPTPPSGTATWPATTRTQEAGRVLHRPGDEGDGGKANGKAVAAELARLSG